MQVVGTDLVDMIGIYHGNEKPKDSNEFLEEFVRNAINIINNGIFIKHRFFNVKVKSFICDAPTKSFVKCVKNHTGYSSRSKCHIALE